MLEVHIQHHEKVNVWTRIVGHCIVDLFILDGNLKEILIATF